MLPMSSPDINPGATETQQMRVVAPVGVRCSLIELCVYWNTDYDHYHSQSAVRLRLRISFSVGGRAVQDQVDFSGFPPGLISGT